MGFEPRDGKMDDIDSRLGWNPKDRNPFLISNPFPTSIPCAKVTTLMWWCYELGGRETERERRREGGRDRERERERVVST